jgi:hypothetical protein
VSLDVPGVAARIYDDDHDHDHDHNDDGTDHNGAAYMRNGPGPFGLSDSLGGDDGKHDVAGSAGGAAPGRTSDTPNGYITLRLAKAAAFSTALVFGMLTALLIFGMAALYEAGVVQLWYVLIATPILVGVYVVYVLPGLCSAAVRAACRG